MIPMLQSLPQLAFSELLFEGERNRAAMVERPLADEVRRILAGGAKLTAQTAALIRVFPGVSYVSGRQMLAHPTLGPLLRESPYAALSAVYGEPSLAAELEETIFLHGEVFYSYESWRRENSRPLAAAPDRYRKALLRDPFWGFRVVKVTGSASDGRLLFDSCDTSRTTNPIAAATWLMMTQGEGARAYTDLLHTSPFAAYIGARFFGLHGFELNIEAVEEMNPRWACHFALLEPAKVHACLYERLLDCPAWMIEFQMKSGLWHNPGATAAEVNKSFARMRSQNTPPTKTFLAASPYLRIALDWLATLITYDGANALPDLIKHGKRMARPVERVTP
jgi:hypothetical protein